MNETVIPTNPVLLPKAGYEPDELTRLTTALMYASVALAEWRRRQGFVAGAIVKIKGGNPGRNAKLEELVISADWSRWKAVGHTQVGLDGLVVPQSLDSLILVKAAPMYSPLQELKKANK